MLTEAAGLEAGDELAIFTPEGMCAGAGVWNGSAIAIAVWADDPTTEGAEGFTAGQLISFRVWRSSTATEFTSENGLSIVLGDGGVGALYVEDAVVEVMSVSIDETTAAEQAPIASLDLAPNFPNPFRGATTIPFSLPTPGQVRLDLYDVVGRHVSTVLDEYRDRGHHEALVDASSLPSGTYLYRLHTPDDVAQRKMTVLRD